MELQKLQQANGIRYEMERIERDLQGDFVHDSPRLTDEARAVIATIARNCLIEKLASLKAEFDAL